MNANLAHIVGIEAICAATGIEARAPLPTSAPLQAAVARLRQEVAPLGQDRYLAPDLVAAAGLVTDIDAEAGARAAFARVAALHALQAAIDARSDRPFPQADLDLDGAAEQMAEAGAEEDEIAAAIRDGMRRARSCAVSTRPAEAEF